MPKISLIEIFFRRQNQTKCGVLVKKFLAQTRFVHCKTKVRSNWCVAWTMFSAQNERFQLCLGSEMDKNKSKTGQHWTIAKLDRNRVQNSCSKAIPIRRSQVWDKPFRNCKPEFNPNHQQKSPFLRNHYGLQIASLIASLLVVFIFAEIISNFFEFFAVHRNWSMLSTLEHKIVIF